MSLGRELRRRGRHIIGPTLGALVVGYFLIHSIYGDRGMQAWMQLRHQVVRGEKALAATTAQRVIMTARIAQLRSHSLDRDLLDRQARYMGGLAQPDEFVIYELPGSPAP